MSKNFFRNKTFQHILIFILILTISLGFILPSLDYTILDKKLIFTINFIFIILTIGFYIFTKNFLKSLVQKSNLKIFKSKLLNEYFIEFIVVLISIIFLLITFEIFHYICYGNFNFSYIYDVLTRSIYSGRFLTSNGIFIENSKEINSVMLNILVINSIYVEWSISLIKPAILFIFINYITRNLNKGPVV